MTATRDLFAGHSIRCTPQRMAVYAALHQSKSHPTAEELYRQSGRAETVPEASG